METTMSAEYHNLSTIFGEGKFTIHVTDATHAYVSTIRNEAITVNRVQVRASAHLFLWADGSWQIGRETENSYEHRMHLYVTRIDNHEGASEAIRTKIADQLHTTVTNFLRNNPSIIVEAQREHLRNEMEKAEHVYAEALRIVDKTLVARDAAIDAYTSFVAGA
jgi:hypothetical protein